jgi:NAD(P)-dependent dehydrogenase (short-subunit alcohol dehydrogenase family)
MPRNLFDLTGKCALVTGGSSGLGLGFAHALAKSGADVTIWARDPQRTEAAVADLSQHGTRVYGRLVDVSRDDLVVEGMERTIAEMGRLDCVIANAGGATRAPFHEMSSRQYHDLIDTAQHGVFYTLREAAAHMVSRAQAGEPGGSLIISGSLTIFAGVNDMAHYAAAKGATNSMAKAMSVELAPFGVRVNVVVAGATKTPMISTETEEERARIEVRRRRVPMQRLGETDDMDGIIIYLASDLSAYHTGDTIVVDGGHLASLY